MMIALGLPILLVNGSRQHDGHHLFASHDMGIHVFLGIGGAYIGYDGLCECPMTILVAMKNSVGQCVGGATRFFN